MALDVGLLGERDRVLRQLGRKGEVLSVGDLPERPGLYALWPVSQEMIDDLSLPEFGDQAPLLSRPLYVGKAQDSIAGRLGRKHLAAGDTGHSSLRRSFAALLDLPSQPRRTRKVSPSAGELRLLTANYDLDPRADEQLTNWMIRSLLLRVAASEWMPLRQLELAAGGILRPPLDRYPTAAR